MLQPLYQRNAPTQQAPDLTSAMIHVRAASIDEEARTVDAVLATETVAQVYDWSRGEVIDEVLSVAGVEHDDQAPFLAVHNRWEISAVLGALRSIRAEGSELIGTLHFDDTDEHALRAFRKVARKYITDVSVGYRADEWVDIQPGESKTINGRTYTAESRILRVTTKWTLREVSLVPIGADPNAKIRKQPGSVAPTERTLTMNRKLRRYLESIGVVRSEMTEAEVIAAYEALEGTQREHADAVLADPAAFKDDGVTRAASPAQPQEPAPADPPTPIGDNQRSAADPPAPAQTPAPQAPSQADVERQIAERERERIRSIQDLATDQTPDAVITRAISEGLTVEQASLAILEAERGLRGGAGEGQGHNGSPAMHTRGLARNAAVAAMSAGLILRGGLGVENIQVGNSLNPDQRSAAQTQAAEQGERFAHMSLVDMARECLRHEGRSIPYSYEETFRAAASTATFAHIFTDAVTAAVGTGFGTIGDSTLSWTDETDVANFRAHKDITLGKSSGLKKLGRNGKAPDATIDDEAEEYSVASYGEKFIFGEDDMIDDNFGVLFDMPREMAEEAAQLRPDLVYSLLQANGNMADGTALFHADHANLGTGGGSVLGAAGLQAGITAMAKQKRGTRNLNIRPETLIVPQDLRFTAMQLINSAEIREAAAANGTANVIAMENLKVVSENRLGAGGVTSPDTGVTHTGTATNWFLAGPRRTVRVAFLKGRNRRPMVRSFVLSQGEWGIGWDIKHVIGAYPRDFRALYKSDGA